MAGLTKIEEFLNSLGFAYREVAPLTWLLEDEDEGLGGIVVSLAEPIVLIRANICPVPATNKEAFYAELLRLNGESLVHGAYALDGDEVVLVDTLEYAGMDLSELQASLEAMGLALSEHHSTIARYR